MNNPRFRTFRTFIVDKVSDELFWHVNRRNNASMGYHDDDAHIIHIALPKDFLSSLPDHLKAEWKLILRRVNRSKAAYLEIHPTTLSDMWDKVDERETFEEFMQAIRNGELYHRVLG
jgi:hypothetical protein